MFMCLFEHYSLLTGDYVVIIFSGVFRDNIQGRRNGEKGQPDFGRNRCETFSFK